MMKFTPTKLKELLDKYSATDLYTEFEAVISKDCGGEDMGGWNSRKIHGKVEEYQNRWNEKGIRVRYNMVKWWEHNGKSTAPHYRYWMEYADIAVVDKTGVPSSDYGADKPDTAYNPDIDYAKASGDIGAPIKN